MNEDKDTWAAYHAPGEWKEYHSKDIAEIKFLWLMLGLAFGAALGVCFSMWYALH